MNILIQIKTDSLIHHCVVDCTSPINKLNMISMEDFETKDVIFMFNERVLKNEKTWSENGIKENDLIHLSFIDKKKVVVEKVLYDKDLLLKSMTDKPMMRMPMNFSGDNKGYTF